MTSPSFFFQHFSIKGGYSHPFHFRAAALSLQKGSVLPCWSEAEPGQGREGPLIIFEPGFILPSPPPCSPGGPAWSRLLIHRPFTGDKSKAVTVQWKEPAASDSDSCVAGLGQIAPSWSLSFPVCLCAAKTWTPGPDGNSHDWPERGSVLSRLVMG